MKEQKFDNFLILDFEATCEKGLEVDPQEIIEFPCLKVSGSTLEVQSIFHKYVQPTRKLTQFCTELTGITQEMVDNQLFFKDVLKEFMRWGEEEKLWDSNVKSIFVTCGDWDLKTMLPKQCNYLNIPVPDCMKRWINIKKSFKYATGVYPQNNLTQMAEILHVTMEGRLHSGIDDCKNIHNILCELAKRNFVFKETTKF